MNTYERAQVLMDEQNRTPADLARAIGTTHQRVYNWKKRGNIPAPELAAVAKFLGTTANYLLTGEQATVPVPAYSIQSVDDPELLDPQQFAELPVMDVHLSAGNGAPVPEFVETEYTLPFQTRWLRKKGLDPEQVRLMPVRGDSMAPYLEPDDVVMIDLSKTRLIDYEVYAIIHGGEPKIKRLKKRYDGGLVIMSDNPSYEDEEVPPEALEYVVILGRKVWRGG